MVADALATPIAGYETELGLYGFRELITPRCGRYCAARYRLVRRLFGMHAASPPSRRRITGWWRRTPLPAR